MENLKGLSQIYADLIFRAGIILVIISSLFFFSNWTTDFFDTPKFLVLIAVTGILLVLISLRFTLTNKLVFIRTPLDVPLLLILAVGIVSTVFSQAPFISLLGNQLKIHSSLSSWAVYIIFYFVLVNSLKNQKEIKWILFITTLAAGLLSVISLSAYMGVKLLPPPWTHGINFSPAGSSFSTTAVLALLIPVVSSQLLSGGNLFTQVINSVLLTIFAVTIALTGGWATWIAGLAGFLLTLSNHRFFEKLTQIKPLSLIGLAVPTAAVVLVTILSLIPPLGGAKNPLYNQAKSFPKENQLPFAASWKISVSSFRDAPFWGTGPGTYAFDFTQYKPLEFNSSKIWNLRFDSAFNEYLQVLATLGGVGLVGLLSLTALYISSAYPSLVRKTSEVSLSTSEVSRSEHALKTALAVSGLLFFIILALHPSSLVLWIFGLIILASFMVLNLQSEANSKSWSSPDLKQTLLKIASNVSSMNSSAETIKAEALPSILLTVCLGLTLATFFFAGKFALADYHHRIAVNALSQNQGVVAYNELVAAEKLNPISDLYRIDLAQTNFALANAIAQAKAPNEASPDGSLTDQDKQNIQVLLQQSINEGKSATALNPRSTVNWEILGLLYRQIAGVAQNALVFSLDAYGRAIFVDPLNPNLRLSVGGVYYAVKNYDLAIRFFTDSINLKPDFANGYYNLSVALRDKGDLATAQAAGEKVLTLVDKNSQDYKVASDYLNDLKSKRSEKPAEPPAAQTTGALQQKGLPKVVNIGNPPEKIATPGAVKKPNSTPEPTSQP